MPAGIGRQKPHHYRDMLRVAWENRHELPFAWRILTQGCCDGCALGTSGLSDWTMPGTHLCMVRLELLGLNTGPALDVSRLANVAALRHLRSAQLRALGRLPVPLVRRPGDAGFRPIEWDEAIDVAAGALRTIDPRRAAFYFTSRGITNEVYYAGQKAARAYGSPHIDNSARLCHAASTVAMKTALGYGASTCSYADWIGADLIVFFGSNTPNNQPVTVKYLHYARQRGAEIAVVNPVREPGLEQYWVPSIAESAIFGTKLATHWFPVQTGGDLAFLVGALKALDEAQDIDSDFVTTHTDGFPDVLESVRAISWSDIERESGMARSEIQRFARLLRDRPNAVFVWSMGLTQHAHGVRTIHALVNVALARGLLGRPHRGLMPIRGHSGVQGGAEVGCVPAIDTATRQRWSRLWGFPVPEGDGLTASGMVAAAARGDIDAFWIVGGNFLETLAGDTRVIDALSRPRLRIHHDIVLTSAMLVEPSDTVLLLPATTRYESPGGGTETSTERRIIFSPEIAGRRVGTARPEWQVFGEVMGRVQPSVSAAVRFDSADAIRREIAEAVPLYAGIERLAAAGDQVQWGGGPRLFEDGRFKTPTGRAQAVPVALAGTGRRPGQFVLSTRRGKQFNSMVQREQDPLNGTRRDAVLISSTDAERIGVRHGDRLVVVSPHGRFEGRAHISPIRSGDLEVHWPEGMSLLNPDRVDEESGEPDYNVDVQLAKA
jgi:molybdopterin-dependent oxidoreductase alpha subunit